MRKVKTVLDIMGRGFTCEGCGANYNFPFNYCPDCGLHHGGYYKPNRALHICGETIWLSITGVGNYHVCKRTKGPKGKHECANCELRWS